MASHAVQDCKVCNTTPQHGSCLCDEDYVKEILAELDECRELLSEKVRKILELEREIEGVYEDAAGADL